MSGSADTQTDFRVKAKAYIREKSHKKGGLPTALCGFRHKTGPRILGTAQNVTVSGVTALFFRVLLFLGTASVPVFARKLVLPPGTPDTSRLNDVAQNTLAMDKFYAAVHSLDVVDLFLVVAVALFTGVPKLMDAAAKLREGPEDHTPHRDLAAALQAMPSFAASDQAPIEPSRTDALRHCLNALKVEISQIIGENRQTCSTEVSLLEFCPPSGEKMRVRARTSTEETMRPRASDEFFAFHVAMGGRWFAEHDFLSSENPCKKTRLTILGNPAVNYRSVLYLPIYVSRRIEGQALGAGQHGAGIPEVVDYCIGVICVHSPKAYRF